MNSQNKVLTQRLKMEDSPVYDLESMPPSSINKTTLNSFCTTPPSYI